DTGILPAVVEPNAERGVVHDEVALDQAIAEGVDFDAAGFGIGQVVWGLWVFGAYGGVIANDVVDDADGVGVPGGNAALCVVGDEVAFDEVTSADEKALVLRLGGAQ